MLRRIARNARRGTRTLRGRKRPTASTMRFCLQERSLVNTLIALILCKSVPSSSILQTSDTIWTTTLRRSFWACLLIRLFAWVFPTGNKWKQVESGNVAGTSNSPSTRILFMPFISLSSLSSTSMTVVNMLKILAAWARNAGVPWSGSESIWNHTQF